MLSIDVGIGMVHGDPLLTQFFIGNIGHIDHGNFTSMITMVAADVRNVKAVCSKKSTGFHR
jgi:hypothetical protein